MSSLVERRYESRRILKTSTLSPLPILRLRICYFPVPTIVCSRFGIFGQFFVLPRQRSMWLTRRMRRSLKNGRPSGTLAGHTEGITYLAPKGDGRYCISNGKDQTLRLWDLRTISEEMDEKIRVDRRDYGISGWDYRNTSYAKPRFVDHPYDMCVAFALRRCGGLKLIFRFAGR